MNRIMKRTTAFMLTLVFLAVSVMLPGAYRSVTANALEFPPDAPQWETTVESGGYTIRLWISESEFGSDPEYCYKGIRYYLNYQLKDSAGALVTSIPGNFSASMNIIRPDGSTAYGSAFSMQNQYWINSVADTLGLWTGVIEFTGYFTGKQTVSWYVGEPSVNLRVWVSDDKYGDIPDSFYAGNWYYLCYELTDLRTEKLLNSSITGYKSNLTIYKPDGTVGHTYDYDSTPKTWISFRGSDVGTYRGVVTLTGDIDLEIEISWDVTKMLTGADKFVWGADNFKFGNSDEDFPDGYQINASIMDTLADTYIKDKFYATLFKERAGRMQKVDFGGSCYGSTIAQILAKQGDLDLTEFGGSSIVNVSYPTQRILSVINFFYNTQNDGGTSMARRYSETRAFHNTFTQDQILASIEKELLTGGDLLNVCINTNPGGHSLLAYGVEEVSYTSDQTNRTYDRRILIADPNYLSKNGVNERSCIYYDSKDYSYVIPAYNVYWNAKDGKTRDNGFIKAGMTHHLTDSGMVVRNVLDEAAEIPQNYGELGFFIEDGTTVSLNTYTGSRTLPRSAEEDIPLEQIGEGNDRKFTSWLLLSGADRIAAFSEPSNTHGFVFDYGDVGYYGDVTNVSEMVLFEDAALKLDGSAIRYDISIAGKDGDWCSVGVAGANTDSVLFTRTDEGYVLTADKLEGITVNVVPFRYDEVKALFSTKHTKVLIYEVSPTVIGVAADADGDGEFDTDILGNRYAVMGDLEIGDVNADGIVDAGDAADILVEAALDGSGKGMFTDSQKTAGDVNFDGLVDASDAAVILVFSALKGSNSFAGTFEEYLAS